MKPPHPSRHDTYVPAFTGLRALAAALVFAHHHSQLYGEGGGIYEYLQEGYVGVTLFFTLSGFLITRTYADSFRERKITFSSYWLKRFARIYPVYLVVLLGVVALGISRLSAASLAANLTLTQAFFPAYKFTGVDTAWSLTVEECFYLMAPFLLMRFGTRAGAGARNTITLLVIACALAGAGYLLHGLSGGGAFLGKMDDVWIYNIFGRFTEFGIGILAALCFRRSKKGIGGNVSFVSFLFAFPAAIFLLDALRKHYGAWHGIETPFGVSALWPVAGATTLFLYAGVQQSTWLNRFFGNRWVEYLGRISYVLYLLQDRALSGKINELIRGIGLPDSNLVVSYLGFSVCAAILYEGVEKPLHRIVLKRGSVFVASPKRQQRPKCRSGRKPIRLTAE